MSYVPDYTPESIEDLYRLPVHIQELVVNRIDELAQRPTELSCRSHFPYRENCQLFKFEIEDGTQRYVIHAMFQYSRDEVHLIIIGIKCVWPPP